MAKSAFSDGAAPSLPNPIELREAGADDIEAIMRLERGPGFEAWVGRSSADEHRALMRSGNHRYLLGLRSREPIAFAILRDLEEPNGNVYLKRVAALRPGEGLGLRFLRELAAWIYAHPAAHRFWLDCFPDNLRAQRAYEKLGMRRDGILRGAYLSPSGERRDLVMMAMTRDDWARDNSI